MRMFQNYILCQLNFYQVPHSSGVVKGNCVLDLYINAVHTRCKVYENEIIYAY